MKSVIASAAMLLLLGTASAYAQQDKGQEEHKQDGRSAPQQDKPARQEQQRQTKPESNQQAKTQTDKPAQQEHTQQTPPIRQAHAVNHTQQSDAGRNQAQVQQTHAGAGNKSRSNHGRISDAHYTSSFGRGHSFHVSRGQYASRRFDYGGYSFGFVDAWPIDWGYADDVYVVYADGGYYMYDRVHPGVRISIDIF